MTIHENIHELTEQKFSIILGWEITTNNLLFLSLGDCFATMTQNRDHGVQIIEARI